MAMISTITQSTTLDESYKDITRDYFIMKEQKIEKKSKLDGGEEFLQLRKDTFKGINDQLKLMMIINGQQIGLQVRDMKTKEERLVQTYQDIGYVWKTDASMSAVVKINTIVNSTFTETSGYFT